MKEMKGSLILTAGGTKLFAEGEEDINIIPNDIDVVINNRLVSLETLISCYIVRHQGNFDRNVVKAHQEKLNAATTKYYEGRTGATLWTTQR